MTRIDKQIKKQVIIFFILFSFIIERLVSIMLLNRIKNADALKSDMFLYEDYFDMYTGKDV
jgi:hypothetical protein